jgi:hypothetical protein
MVASRVSTAASEGGFENAMENPLEFAETTRRDVLRKAVFITPVILTLPVIPSFARAGSNAADDQDDPHDANISGGSTNSSGGLQSNQRRRRRHHWWFFSW